MYRDLRDSTQVYGSYERTSYVNFVYGRDIDEWWSSRATESRDDFLPSRATRLCTDTDTVAEAAPYDS